MANYTAAWAVHKTTAPAAVDEVTLTGNSARVEVINRGSDSIFFTLNNVPPTVAGDNTQVVPAGTALSVSALSGDTVVRLISNSAVAYSVVLR